MKTVIDRVCTFLRRNRDDMKDKMGQMRSIINCGVTVHGFGFDKGFQSAVSELVAKSDDKGDTRERQLESAEGLYDDTTDRWKVFRGLYRSRLYRYLKRAKPVSNPINETNILLMEKNYNAIFKFWKKFQKELAPKERLAASETDLDILRDSYELFCKALCGYTAHSMKFEETGEGEFRRKSDEIQITVSREAGNIAVTIADVQKRRLRIAGKLRSPIGEGESLEGFEYRNGELLWDNNLEERSIEQFCRRHKTSESKETEPREKQRRYDDLKKALLEEHKSHGKPKCFRIAVVPTFYELEDDNRNLFAEKMAAVSKEFTNVGYDYVVIAMPKCSGCEQKLTSYAIKDSDQLAFLPLSMFDINSYRRPQVLFLRLILRFGRSAKCPYCGGNMRPTKNGPSKCDECQLISTETQCGECKSKYTYLSYEVRDEVASKIKAALETGDDFFATDSVFQYKNIVDLSVKDGRIIPVCPKCGNCCSPKS